MASCTRLWEEIAVLQAEGASIQLLTNVDQSALPGGVAVTLSTEPRPLPGPSRLRWAPARFVDEVLRVPVRWAVWHVRPDRCLRMRSLAHAIALKTDLFWAIDFFSLREVMQASSRSNTPIVYETFDLVTEYASLPPWRRELLRRLERRALRRIAGFVTATESYADYYVERYGSGTLDRRPTVRSNVPGEMAERPGPTGRPLRLLFLGYLQPDRPIYELIEAMSMVSSGVTLTFQGVNRLGDGPRRAIAELHVADRVYIADPCPPTDVVRIAAGYDVGVAALRGADENERRAATTKLFTYMSAGLAVLGSDLPGIARVVRQHHNGMLVAGATPHAWAEAIDAIAALPDGEIDAMRSRSLLAARGYSWVRERPAFLSEFIQARARRRHA